MKLFRLFTLIAASVLLLPAFVEGDQNGAGGPKGPQGSGKGPTVQQMYRFSGDRECCGDTALIRLKLIVAHLDTVQQRLELALAAQEDPGLIHPVDPVNALYSLANEYAVVGGRVIKAQLRLYQSAPLSDEETASMLEYLGGIRAGVQAIASTIDEHVAAQGEVAEPPAYALGRILDTSEYIEESVVTFPLYEETLAP